jgi:hypothetical protein
MVCPVCVTTFLVSQAPAIACLVAGGTVAAVNKNSKPVKPCCLPTKEKTHSLEITRKKTEQ